MKIVNETVYSNDDIYNLFIAVNRLCWRAMEITVDKWKAQAKAEGRIWNDTGGYYKEQRPLPRILRIGYRTYKVKTVDQDGKPVKQTEPSFVSARGRYTDSPRFGIVKPVHLPLNPLVVLAHCADGARREIPREVMQALARTFSRNMKGSPSDDQFSDLIDDHQITFSLDVSRAAKAAAKAAAKKARVASLEYKIRIKIREINETTARLNKRQEQLAVLNIRLDKIQPQEERMTLCV